MRACVCARTDGAAHPAKPMCQCCAIVALGYDGRQSQAAVVAATAACAGAATAACACHACTRRHGHGRKGLPVARGCQMHGFASDCVGKVDSLLGAMRHRRHAGNPPPLTSTPLNPPSVMPSVQRTSSTRRCVHAR